MKKILILVIVLFNTVLMAQKNNFDHKVYVEELQKAKDFKYQEYLKEYDEAIVKNPKNVDLKVQKCEFINYSSYDEYEGYSLNYEAYEECVNALYKKYPNNARVVLFKAKNTYGDSLQVVLDKAQELIKQKPKAWNSFQASELYYSLARKSYNNDENDKALLFLTKAKRYKDTVDNTILATEIYLEADKKEVALKEILSKVDKDVALWLLNSKASLLLKLEAPEQALEVYKRVEAKDSTYVNNSNLSRTFEELQQYDIARSYLVKDTVKEWRKATVLSEIVNFDLKHSNAEKALISYRASQKENFYDDFWGVKRFKIFLKAPFLAVNLNDFLCVFIFLGTVLVLFVLPYVLVLPIQFLGNKFKLKPMELKVPFNWNLKHFWLTVFIFLLIEFLLELIFDYQGFLDAYFSDAFSDETIIPIDVNLHIAYFTTMFIAIVLFLNKTRLRYLIKSNIPLLRTISLFVVFMILNLALVKILKSSGLIVSLNIKEEINEIIIVHGFWIAFLFVVVLVPIYEEIIFRGIVLSSVEKHLGFWKANVIQAILFALVHQNFTLFLFYLFFALGIGLIVKKSKGLLVGILFHAGNNCIFLITMYNLIQMEQILKL